VFLDNKRRALFASNYDGSDEAYMDDFVNKVFFGLNLAFSQVANIRGHNFCSVKEPIASKNSKTLKPATHCRPRSGTKPIPDYLWSTLRETRGSGEGLNAKQ
jgi:hypothetical protein